MSRPVRLTNRARRDLRRIGPAVAGQVVEALEHFAETGHGDVKKLCGVESEWRLRVSEWRVRLTIEKEALIVLRVLPRGKVYR